jgi:hypothetical protein
MDSDHEHRYHDAAHFDTELYGKPGNFSVRITWTDFDKGAPDYMAAYVSIRFGVCSMTPMKHDARWRHFSLAYITRM